MIFELSRQWFGGLSGWLERRRKVNAPAQRTQHTDSHSTWLPFCGCDIVLGASRAGAAGTCSANVAIITVCTAMGPAWETWVAGPSWLMLAPSRASFSSDKTAPLTLSYDKSSLGWIFFDGWMCKMRWF